MIEKLNVAYIQVESDGNAKLELANKINELVDAVNSLRDDCNLLMGYIAPENKCEPAENGEISKMEKEFAEEELERTRKALEIAVDALKWIHETYNLGMGYEAAIMEKCEYALEQITTQEQKE